MRHFKSAAMASCLMLGACSQTALKYTPWTDGAISASAFRFQLQKSTLTLAGAAQRNTGPQTATTTPTPSPAGADKDPCAKYTGGGRQLVVLL